MELKIELDLQALITSAVSAEKIQPLLDKAISNAIASAIQDATGYSSPFSKALKQQLSEAMPHGLSIDDVAKFQHVLNAAVTDAVRGENAATINAALLKAATVALPDVPARIKMSELLSEARDSFHLEENEAFYAKYEPSEYGGGHLYLDGDKDKREKYRSDIRLSFNKEGEVYSVHLDGKAITPKSMPNAVGSFDGLLLSMYVGRTSLEIDCDADDVESAASEQYND